MYILQIKFNKRVKKSISFIPLTHFPERNTKKKTWQAKFGEEEDQMWRFWE
jgi:hypothetical protein